MQPRYFTINTSSGKPCVINLDNVADVCLAKDGSWKLEFCIVGGQVNRLSFWSNNYDDISGIMEKLIEFCKNEKINIFVRRNRDDLRQRDNHVLLIFAKYNAYINHQSAEIIDVDNRKWNIRPGDIVEEFFYDEEQNQPSVNLDLSQIETNISNNVTRAFAERIDELEKTVCRTIKKNMYNSDPVVLQDDKTTSKEIKEMHKIEIPSTDEIKKSMEENRNSFLRRKS